LAIMQMERQPSFIWKLLPETPVGRALVAATRRLEEAGIDTAGLDAQVLLAYVLDHERTWLFAHHDYLLTPAEADAYAELVVRRAAAEPVAYLVGHREFYGLDLRVDPRVLIPRPETEMLVDAVLDYCELHDNPPLSMADVGTGSGAIALAVAANAPNLRVYAIDLSADALDVARANVARLDERGQITLLQGDLLAPLPEPVDIVAANLPYVTSDDYLELMADVRDYEPRLALEAGPEGLDVIRRLLRQVAAHVNPVGILFLEIGHNQGQAVAALAEQLLPQARHIGVRQDYHGYDRVVVIPLA
jgi:release factor glutamine methyltransferase